MIAPDLNEVAGIDRDITRGLILYGMPLIPTDPVLAARGGDYRLWEWVLQDDQVAACLQQRRLAVTSRAWTVEPGGTASVDKKAAASLQAQLEHIGWDHVTDLMLYGLFYGHSIAECLYAQDGAEVVLDQVRVRRRRRFGWDQDTNLLLRTLQNPMGEPLPPQKFWWFSIGGDHDDDPYGIGLASWLYWPVFFKRNGIKAYLLFLDKYAQPTVKATYGQSASAQDQALLLKAAQAVASSSAIKLPEGTQIELMEASRSGTADYQALHQIMLDAITLVILSQTMTSRDGSSRSQAEVHERVKEDLVDADTDLINDSFRRGPATWLTAWNYPGAAVPILKRQAAEQQDLNAQATRDVALSGIGFRPTLDYITATYGEGFADLGPPRPAPPAIAPGTGADSTAFADPAADPHADGPPLPQQLADQLAPAADALVAEWLQQVRQVLGEATTLQEAQDRLAGLNIDPAVLGELMGEALTAADLGGRFDALRSP